jgi:intracellular sulfur oxidation DsrE/DsrF family protein
MKTTSRLLPLFILFLTTFSVVAQNTEVADLEPHKLVIQLTSPDTLVHKGLIKQLNNILAAAPNTQLEVICHGPGISFLQLSQSTVLPAIKKLKEKVTFVACENTLLEKKIAKADIAPEADYVKAGIVQLIIRQEQGWSYVKAGF